MKLDKIQAQLQSLGYNNDPSTSVYIESAGGLVKNLLGNLSVLSDKYYVASFQNDGILFMGLNMLRKFNGTQHFVPLSELGEVTFTKTKFMNGRLLLNAMKLEIADSNGGKAPYICYTFMAGEKFWKENIQNAKQVVAEWPTIAQRKRTPADSRVESAQHSDDFNDQLRKLKSLLDDGVLTQEEFDTKKKQILGI